MKVKMQHIKLWLWDTMKAVGRGTFIALKVYIRREEKSQLNS